MYFSKKNNEDLEVCLANLPWKINTDDIKSYFEDYNVKIDDI
jgi:hypothetical protein